MMKTHRMGWHLFLLGGLVIQAILVSPFLFFSPNPIFFFFFFLPDYHTQMLRASRENARSGLLSTSLHTREYFGHLLGDGGMESLSLVYGHV